MPANKSKFNVNFDTISKLKMLCFVLILPVHSSSLGSGIHTPAPEEFSVQTDFNSVAFVEGNKPSLQWYVILVPLTVLL